MKVLDTTNITNTSQFPIKKGTLDFLQFAHIETVKAVIKGLIGSTYSDSIFYILSGCVNTGSGLNYIISEGYIYYNGYINFVPAVSFTATSGQVAVLYQNIVPYTTYADPVTFSDTTVRYVHNDYQWGIESGVAGSGAVNYSALNRLQLVPPAQVNITGTGSATVSGTYPNININVGGFTAPNLTLLWIGTLNCSAVTVTKLFGTNNVTSVTKSSTGVYILNHNIGNTNYFVDGVGTGSGQYASVRSFFNKTSAAITIQISDDNSSNDFDQEIRIYGYA